jgi:large subunit ribosomal protein L9
MKVILLKDVPKVGKKFDIKDMSDGYALNFLMPRGLAERATTEKIAELEKRRAANQESRDHAEMALRDAISGLEGQKITMHAKADERGHLFKKLRVADVLVPLKERSSVLELEHIALDGPLATLGEHVVRVSGAQTHADITVVVERE